MFSFSYNWQINFQYFSKFEIDSSIAQIETEILRLLIKIFINLGYFYKLLFEFWYKSVSYWLPFHKRGRLHWVSSCLLFSPEKISMYLLITDIYIFVSFQAFLTITFVSPVCVSKFSNICKRDYKRLRDVSHKLYTYCIALLQ